MPSPPPTVYALFRIFHRSVGVTHGDVPLFVAVFDVLVVILFALSPKLYQKIARSPSNVKLPCSVRRSSSLESISSIGDQESNCLVGISSATFHVTRPLVVDNITRWHLPPSLRCSNNIALPTVHLKSRHQVVRHAQIPGASVDFLLTVQKISQPTQNQ